MNEDMRMMKCNGCNLGTAFGPHFCDESILSGSLADKIFVWFSSLALTTLTFQLYSAFC